MSSVFASLDMNLAQVEVARSEWWKVSLIQSLTWNVLWVTQNTKILLTFDLRNKHDKDEDLYLES